MARTRISPAPGAFACSSRSAACLGPSNQRARAFKLFDMTVTFPLSSARTGRAFSIVLTDDVLRDLLRSHHGCKIGARRHDGWRSEEHTSELQSLMRNSYAVFCLKKKKK